MLTYEDFPVGKVFDLPQHTITETEIIEFAEQFDPQPFHTDPHSKQAEQTNGLIASGWHTCSILMRMMCDAYLCDTASQGSGGLDNVKWLLPVRPNDILSGTAEVIDHRVSKSKPDLGLVTFLYSLTNQDGATVVTMKGMGMINVKETAAA